MGDEGEEQEEDEDVEWKEEEEEEEEDQEEEGEEEDRRDEEQEEQEAETEQADEEDTDLEESEEKEVEEAKGEHQMQESFMDVGSSSLASNLWGIGVALALLSGPCLALFVFMAGDAYGLRLQQRKFSSSDGLLRDFLGIHLQSRRTRPETMRKLSEAFWSSCSGGDRNLV